MNGWEAGLMASGIGAADKMAGRHSSADDPLHN